MISAANLTKSDFRKDKIVCIEINDKKDGHLSIMRPCFRRKKNFRANVFQIFEARISCTLLEFDDNNNRFSMTLQQQ
jgi:hypothetical protein